MKWFSGRFSPFSFSFRRNTIQLPCDPVIPIKTPSITAKVHVNTHHPPSTFFWPVDHVSWSCVTLFFLRQKFYECNANATQWGDEKRMVEQSAKITWPINLWFHFFVFVFVVLRVLLFCSIFSPETQYTNAMDKQTSAAENERKNCENENNTASAWCYFVCFVLYTCECGALNMENIYSQLFEMNDISFMCDGNACVMCVSLKFGVLVQQRIIPAAPTAIVRFIVLILVIIRALIYRVPCSVPCCIRITY